MSSRITIAHREQLKGQEARRWFVHNHMKEISYFFVTSFFGGRGEGLIVGVALVGVVSFLFH